MIRKTCLGPQIPFWDPGRVKYVLNIFTFNLYWLSDLSMRLGSIVCAALTTIVIFESGTLLKNEKSGIKYRIRICLLIIKN